MHTLVVFSTLVVTIVIVVAVRSGRVSIRFSWKILCFFRYGWPIATKWSVNKLDYIDLPLQPILVTWEIPFGFCNCTSVSLELKAVCYHYTDSGYHLLYISVYSGYFYYDNTGAWIYVDECGVCFVDFGYEC